MKNYFAIIMMSLLSMFGFGIDIPDLRGQQLSLTFSDRLSGEIIDLEDYKGKPVLIHFWYNECSPCQDTMIEISNLYDIYRYREFQIIGINLDTSEDILISSSKEKRITWPQKFDLEEGLDKSFSYSNGIKTFPYFILIDSNSIVLESTISIALIKYRIENLMEDL